MMLTHLAHRRGNEEPRRISARPPPSPHALRNRAYRARLKASRIKVKVEIGPELIDLLVRARWLAPREAHSRSEIAAAISAMLTDAARS